MQLIVRSKRWCCRPRRRTAQRWSRNKELLRIEWPRQGCLEGKYRRRIGQQDQWRRLRRIRGYPRSFSNRSISSQSFRTFQTIRKNWEQMTQPVPLVSSSLSKIRKAQVQLTTSCNLTTFHLSPRGASGLQNPRRLCPLPMLGNLLSTNPCPKSLLKRIWIRPSKCYSSSRKKCLRSKLSSRKIKLWRRDLLIWRRAGLPMPMRTLGLKWCQST